MPRSRTFRIDEPEYVFLCVVCIHPITSWIGVDVREDDCRPILNNTQ